MHKATGKLETQPITEVDVSTQFSINKIEVYLGAAFSAFLEAIRPFGAEDNYHKKKKKKNRIRPNTHKSN